MLHLTYSLLRNWNILKHFQFDISYVVYMYEIGLVTIGIIIYVCAIEI